MKNSINDKSCKCFLHNVKWLRKHYRFSKKEMAKILNIGIKSLTKIENGELPPKLGVNIIFNIYDTFGISAKDLFSKWYNDDML